MWQVDGGPWVHKPAATYLALELAMLSASRPDLVQSVEITRDLIVVTKGHCADIPTPFDVSASYLTANRVFIEDGFSPPGRQQSRTTEELIAARLDEVTRAIEGSLSWRITAPLRRIRRRLLP